MGEQPFQSDLGATTNHKGLISVMSSRYSAKCGDGEGRKRACRMDATRVFRPCLSCRGVLVTFCCRYKVRKGLRRWHARTVTVATMTPALWDDDDDDVDAWTRRMMAELSDPTAGAAGGRGRGRSGSSSGGGGADEAAGGKKVSGVQFRPDSSAVRMTWKGSFGG